jgi:putative ABC transport system permease protein
MAEALLCALGGAAIGAAIAWAAFNGHTISTIQGSGQVVAHMSIDGSLFVLAVVWACAIGLLGAVFPAIRAARLPVAEALRAI